MVLKLYTFERSPYGRRVAAILHEKKIPYELVQPNLEGGEIKSAEWTSKQPFGQMPYIDDDGFVLFESAAIVRYIATKYASSGTPLLPEDASDIQATALLDQAVSVEASNFDAFASALAAEKFSKPRRGLQTDEKVVTHYEKLLSGKLDGFEKILGNHRYMAGDSLTFVDLLYLPYGSILTQGGYTYLTDETKYPNIARWWKEVSTRDSWLAVKESVPPSL